jgi:hypothetical protein
MSQENSTKNIEEIARTIIRIKINRTDAEDLLRQFNAPFPPTEYISEIRLYVENDDDAKEDDLE